MFEKLTRQEQKVFDMLLEGISLNDIALKLNIVYRTVDYHKTNIYRKLHVKSMQEFYTKYGTKSQNDSLQYTGDDFINESKPAEVAQQPKKKQLIPFLVIFTTVLTIITTIFLIWNTSTVSSDSTASVSLASAKTPLTITLFDFDLWDNTFAYYPFESNGITITAGDNFTFYYTFTSDTDLDMFYFIFIDNSVEFYSELSPNTHIKANVKANTEYSGKVTVIASKTANSPQPNANMFYLHTYRTVSRQPTITFTRFELVRN